MPQTEVWEREYQSPQLITKYDKPQNDVLRFLRWLKKDRKTRAIKLSVLDLGCGTGRNSNYLASLGNKVTGIDISRTAIGIASQRANQERLSVRYINGDIGSKLPFDDKSIDLILDITSSNSLSEAEREIYLEETRRVLKPNGHFFIRALCKDGDRNAKNLLEISPGKEQDTYIMSAINLTERVFSNEDFCKLYGNYFKINKVIKNCGYARFKGQSYKRNYLLAYLSNKKQA